jgi:hypothetical protein
MIAAKPLIAGAAALCVGGAAAPLQHPKEHQPSRAVSGARPIQPKRVGLEDARFPPTKLTILKPGARVRWMNVCQPAGSFSEVSAYRWNGTATAAQKIAGSGRSYWTTSSGRIVFDEDVFVNHSRESVIVAGWCE